MKDQNEKITGAEPREEKPGVKGKQKTVSFFLLLLLWVGLVGGGFWGARGYLLKTERRFLDRIDEIKQENRRLEKEIVDSMQMFNSELNRYEEEIRLVNGELSLIREELELTGESLTGTDETRQSLQERMTELDQQLTALKDQLRKLEAAVRAL